MSQLNGFRGLLIDAYGSTLSLPDLSQSGRQEIRHILASSDQELVGLRVELGTKGLGPGADVDHELSRIDRAMESAVELGSPLICLNVGILPPAPERENPKQVVTAEQAGLLILPDQPSTPTAPPAPLTAAEIAFASQLDSALYELGRRADRYNALVALRSDLSSFASLERALSAAACPWFGVDLDLVAVLRDDWSLDQVFARLGSWIRHLRARDAIRGSERRTQPAPIGRGSVDWAALFGNLEHSGYVGWMTIDPLELPNRVAAAVAGQKFLQSFR